MSDQSNQNAGNPVVVVALFTGIYSVVSSFVWGMFFYRGGEASMGGEGFIIDAVIIGFLCYVTTDGMKERGLQAFFGAVLFIFFNWLLKSLLLYPMVVKLFS